MDKAGKAVTVSGVDHEDGNVVVVELSNDTTVRLTVEEVLLLAERQSVKPEGRV